MLGEFIFFFLGAAVGASWMLNRAGNKELETFEQMDERLRKELALHKNLTNSLKADVAYLRKKLYAYEQQGKNKDGLDN